MVATATALLRPACANHPACLQQTIIIATAALIVGVVGLTLFLAERQARQLREITHAVQNLTSGNGTASFIAKNNNDIDDLIRALNRLHDHTNNKLQSLEQKRHELALVLKNMADGVLIANNNGHVHLVNPSACRLLETTENIAIGRPVASIVRHHQLIEMWQICRETEKEQIAAIEVGRHLFLQAVITPFQAQNNTTSYLLILQDLTQIRHLQTVRRDFISNISHELRTPLASLQAVIDTLKDGALDDPPATQRFLNRAHTEVDTLTQMVEELLELSRIESGQVPLRLSATHVSDLLLIPLDRLRSQAERNQVELVLDVNSKLPKVLADAGRIRQVVTNLLHNAIKFTPEGGKVTILAGLNSQTDVDNEPMVLIQVIDSGMGIPQEDLSRIFERFYKSDRARTRGGSGTGLGLAIARHLVEAHNGRIWAKSKIGKGSTFYFTLPTSN